MKRIYFLMAVLLIALSLFGCSSPKPDNGGASQNGQNKTTPIALVDDPYVSLLLNKNMKEKAFEGKEFDYTVKTDKSDSKKGYVVITAFKGGGGLVVIPDKLEGYPVVVVYNSIFTGRSDVVDIIFPDTIREIVFDDYAEVENKQIFGDTQWFQGLPDGFCNAGKVAIGYKGQMPENTTYEVRDGVVSIANRAFCSSRFKNITNVVFPDTVRYISPFSFYGTSMTEVLVQEHWQEYMDAFPRGVDLVLPGTL